MPEPLNDADLDAALASLPGWARDGSAITKAFTFNDFKEAFAFMTRVAFEAEALGHHPDWGNIYNRVTVKLCTHDAGDRVTALDTRLAKTIEGL